MNKQNNLRRAGVLSAWICSFALVFAGSVIARSQDASAQTTSVSTPAGTSSQLVFDDEFNGTSLDLSQWNRSAPDLAAEGPYRYDTDDNVFETDNVSVADGNAVFTAKKQQTDYNGQTVSYQSGMMNTRDKAEFKYGYFEARIKMPLLEGSAPAFWMMPHYSGEGDGSPSMIGIGGEGSEIDIMEHPYPLDGGAAQNNVHWGGYAEYAQQWDAQFADVPNWDTQWHTYGVNWTPDELDSTSTVCW
jgi:beta-glucanase (GH16 family)